MLRRMCLQILLCTLFGFFPPVLMAQQFHTTISVPITSTNSVVAGQLFTLTASLSVYPETDPAATNGLSVVFRGRSGGCTATLQNGVASCQAEESINPGQQPPYGDNIFANFYGNATYSSSTSDGSVYIGIVTPGSTVGAALKGPYALYFDGYTTAGTGDRRVAGLASLTADGNGNLAGVLDYNSALTGVLTKLPVTGTYEIYTAGYGSLELNSALGTLNFDIFTGVPVTTGVKTASLMETGQNILYGTAKLLAQTLSTTHEPSYFNLPMNFHLAGETACAGCQATGPGGKSVLAAGVLYFTNDPSSNSLAFDGYFDQALGSSVASMLSVVGTFTLPDASGRMTLQLSGDKSTAGAPQNYVGYAIDSNHLFLLSTDPHSQYVLLSGEASSQ